MRGATATVILACTAVVATLTFLAGATPAPEPNVSSRYLPPDGRAWSEIESLTENGQTTERALLTESAVFHGAVGVQSLDSLLGEEVTAALGGIDAAMRAHLWRTVSTPVSDDGEGQTVRVFTADGQLALVAEAEAALALVYEPPLPLIPGDAAPGSTWTSAGQTNTGLDYSADLRLDAEDSGDHCLRTSGQLDYAIGNDVMLTRELNYTWCPGEGLTEAAETMADSQLLLQRAPVELPDVDIGPPQSAWSDPQQWTERTQSAQSHLPALGTAAMGGVPTSVPVAQTSGDVLIRSSRSNDVIGFAPTPGESDALTVRWWAHPGGTVLRTVTAGELTLASTDRRELLAYSGTGVRLWRADTADVVMIDPVRLTATSIATLSVSGDVEAFDLTTGERLWHVRLGSAARATPVVSGDVVLVGTADGEISALSLSDGTQRWQAELPSVLVLGTVGDVVLTAGYTSLTALDLHDGTARWSVPIARVRTIVSSGDVAVVVSQDETFAVADDGTELWRIDGANQAVADEDYLAVLHNETLAVLTWAGEPVLTQDLGGAGIGGRRDLVHLHDGVALATDLWLLRAWRP